MSLPPLAQSADKATLFARLGLTDHIHKMMLQEAAEARDRLSKDSGNLTDQSRANPYVQQPYKWDELSETAKHREILRIALEASPQTRPYFDKGRFFTSVGEENWATRWYLWHSFRYRDNRDNRGRGVAGRPSHGYRGNLSTPMYWDPVRHDQ
ncbi:hypothetical protein BU24DRAFT_416342 [Aaosphaeria arxii CBS 175.79]|uniref:Uncharacterized protein n=1 Tax=Aaosphaeria arxii CBS 175.79 TaxID=1450172 RepID=A0A6A5Y523_9PLEO|nr:uncharacterized protein BU24DRAFT_416342 [Aaosphaeria arxii CBS 175.79]KAF2020662.1 hypothetical protein BU24DRAFT_416342 [Aaosphaeria arxii CBS 175.79]